MKIVEILQRFKPEQPQHTDRIVPIWCDDWLVFGKGDDGQWYQTSTEVWPEWLDCTFDPTESTDYDQNAEFMLKMVHNRQRSGKDCEWENVADTNREQDRRWAEQAGRPFDPEDSERELKLTISSLEKGARRFADRIKKKAFNIKHDIQEGSYDDLYMLEHQFRELGLSKEDAVDYSDWVFHGRLMLNGATSRKFERLFTRLAEALRRKRIIDKTPRFVYRGMAVPTRLINKLEKNPTNGLLLVPRVLSSWTISYDDALEYGSYENGAVLCADLTKCPNPKPILYIGANVRRYLNGVRHANDEEVIFAGLPTRLFTRDMVYLRDDEFEGIK